MVALTISLPDERQRRLKALAQTHQPQQSASTI